MTTPAADLLAWTGDRLRAALKSADGHPHSPGAEYASHVMLVSGELNSNLQLIRVPVGFDMVVAERIGANDSVFVLDDDRWIVDIIPAAPSVAEVPVEAEQLLSPANEGITTAEHVPAPEAAAPEHDGAAQ